MRRWGLEYFQWKGLAANLQSIKIHVTITIHKCINFTLCNLTCSFNCSFLAYAFGNMKYVKILQL
jgi:hypothetical protein